MEDITQKLIEKLHKPAPRYTSYPTAVEFEPLSSEIYADKLTCLSKNDKPLSLYFHIPFCKTMCLYCACSVVLNRKQENEERYVDYLIREIELVTEKIGRKRRVTQLHFGGGTPTKLGSSIFERLFQHITKAFEIDFTKEVAIEIDPRTVLENQGEKLKLLRHLGFNRVSFGVQDTNAKVQEAIKRRQSKAMTLETFALARKLGFSGINIDLIYGLPFQTQKSFAQTISDILAMRPDRIALFSYAKVPWLKPHQKAIKEDTLPSAKEKFAIYGYARKTLISHGYLAIGMDHFAERHDEMSKAFLEKRLQRNFQGYTCLFADEMLSFGVTAIGCVQNTYIQNSKKLTEYYQAIDENLLPICRGKVLQKEDILRKTVIHTLMCDFSLDKKTINRKFGIDFNTHFSSSLEKLASMEDDGLVINREDKIEVTPKGELFIRNLAMCFDAYLDKPSTNSQFSQSI